MEPFYSVLIYKDILDQETIQLIYTYLQKAIKVYFLSGTGKEEVEQAISSLYGGRRNPLFVAHREMPTREDFAGDPFLFLMALLTIPAFMTGLPTTPLLTCNNMKSNIAILMNII